MADFELENLCRRYLRYCEHPSRVDELESVKAQIGAMAGANPALVQQALELRRIFQGPGQHSHELRAALLELFDLLPEEPGLSVHVSDSLGVKGRLVGG